MNEEAQTAEPEDGVPDLLDRAANELEQKNRQLELQGAQLAVLSLVDRLLASDGNLKPPMVGTNTYENLASKLRYRAKAMRRVSGRDR